MEGLFLLLVAIVGLRYLVKKRDGSTNDFGVNGYSANRPMTETNKPDSVTELPKEEQKVSKTTIVVSHISGIPFLREEATCTIVANEHAVVINRSYLLPYERLIKVECLSEDKLVEKHKSVIGRAVAGGLLLGPVAALVGGMSGIGNKKEREVTHFFSMDFTDKHGSDCTALFLIGKWGLPSAEQFAKDVNRKLGNKTDQPAVPVPSPQSPYEI